MMHTAELDSAVGCTPQSQTDSKMSVFRVFVLATSFDFVILKNVLSKKRFLEQFVTYSINFILISLGIIEK